MKPLPTEPAEGSVPFFSYSSLISYNTAIILILSSAYGKKKKKVSFLKEEERTLVSEQSRSNHKEDTELRWTFLLGAVPYHSPPSCDHHSLTAFRGSPLGTQAWTQPPPRSAVQEGDGRSSQPASGPVPPSVAPHLLRRLGGPASRAQSDPGGERRQQAGCRVRQPHGLPGAGRPSATPPVWSSALLSAGQLAPCWKRGVFFSVPEVVCSF